MAKGSCKTDFKDPRLDITIEHNPIAILLRQKMKRKLLAICLLAACTTCFTFLILFDGKLDHLKESFKRWSLSNEFLPFSPYKLVVVPASEVEFREANKVIIEDGALFWKGSGAIAVPNLSKTYEVLNFEIINHGSGYSNFVRARVTGPGAKSFVLSNPTVSNGSIKSIEMSRGIQWHTSPSYISKLSELPFSGTTELRYASGQILERRKILNGKTHGTVSRYNRDGIPVHSKEYVMGQKNGTHIYWFDSPVEPDDFKPYYNNNNELIPSLWLKIKEKAKSKFPNQSSTDKANSWAISQFKIEGGSFQVERLEHWKNNLRHGLFEGFDRFGNKTFKDEYNLGLRTKHKIFDVTKRG